MFREMIRNDDRCRSMAVAMPTAAKQAFELCWSVGPRLRECSNSVRQRRRAKARHKRMRGAFPNAQLLAHRFATLLNVLFRLLRVSWLGQRSLLHLCRLGAMA